MPRYIIMRTRTRRVSESTTYELDAANADEARELAIEGADDDRWVVDENETLSTDTDITELPEEN